MSAVRIIRRRAYVSAHPPIRHAYGMNATGIYKIAPRVTYDEWCIKHGYRRAA